jgi:hypothetical protein
MDSYKFDPLVGRMKSGFLWKDIILKFKMLRTIYSRLERFCMGTFQTQKLIRTIVQKDAYAY